MASPLFDGLHLKLSRLISDPVAAAVTDGTQATQAMRTDYLNRANKYLQHVIRGYGLEAVNSVLSGLIATNATATVSGSKSLPTDYSYWLGVQKASGARATYIPGVAKPDLDNNSNPNMTLAFTIVGSTLYIYESGAAISNGAHVLYYIKTDERASNGDTDDISVNLMWHDTIVDIAASFFFTDLGDADKANKYLERAMVSIKTAMGG